MGRPKITRNLNRSNGRNRIGYSSFHSGGASFVFVDGGVYFLTETIEGDFDADDFLTANGVDNITLWEALFARQYGTPVLEKAIPWSTLLRNVNTFVDVCIAEQCDYDLAIQR
ncbi:MAG TPA: DUF1559 domain-containing protein [Pirellulaceae bacterium]|nr:DUF1559 domain-containing protein [Planctomycetales bacterium]MCA9141262.1 DUF1559 domain-containing protein [Planctomycetales bacterium]MCB9938893.1 DUF1559 domain-containing protein [Planctomycetaceae bacterium]HRX78607.1 DUF1559 domain-containing protein [Pirellulaceae bacterium]